MCFITCLYRQFLFILLLCVHVPQKTYTHANLPQLQESGQTGSPIRFLVKRISLLGFCPGTGWLTGLAFQLTELHYNCKSICIRSLFSHLLTFHFFFLSRSLKSLHVGYRKSSRSLKSLLIFKFFLFFNYEKLFLVFLFISLYFSHFSGHVSSFLVFFS